MRDDEIATGDVARRTLKSTLNEESLLKYPVSKYAFGYFRDDDKWIAFDNSTGDCWVEEFATKGQALKWIKAA